MLDCFTTSPGKASTPIDLVPAKDLDAWLARQTAWTSSWVKETGFAGRTAQVLLIPDGNGRRERVAFGLGDGEDRLLAADLPGILSQGVFHFSDIPANTDPALLAYAWAVGCYRFDAYRGTRRPVQARLVLPEGVPSDELARLVEGVYLARDLINTPSNDMGPVELERAVRALAEVHGASCDSVVGDDLLEAGFPLIHAVGRASTRAPRIIDLRWGPEDAPRLTLVGKGVCFDTGGLNLKPGNSMELMKKDMGGAAHVLGLAHMIMGRRMPLRLRVLIPAVENAVSGDAFRPGDVYRSRQGLTVEIANTDAEGRLVLADAMALAGEEEPDLMVVMATLTGAARTALGPEVVPFFTDDTGLATLMDAHAAKVQDPVWRMPLYKPYESMLDSRVADVNHISQSRFAGAITAALFLNRFAKGARSWMHFDLYAWNGQARPGRPVGGEAQAIRALLGALSQRFELSAEAGRDAPPMAPGAS